MTYREEIMDVVRELVRDRPDREFTLDELIAALNDRGSACKTQTVKTYVAGILCQQAPVMYRKRHPTLERVGRGRYRLA
ncbi:DUF7669 domain-containing protein [Deinococcus sedimenti]|uniref:DUF7669 domain-containing protein n=1 Tax=Deinococcus sedimenti TaxID=1867090 RepID=A0ABQ2SA31_9DEIO|nr:hypothetical protein [Deinococcus sedimenti]GGS06775.1 hypothetical protein GCM10008960_36470 [Deinococcus sedimenti]